VRCQCKASGGATVGHLNGSSESAHIALFVSIITVIIIATVAVVIMSVATFPIACGAVTGQPGRQLQRGVTK
jgi:hypothetical protein